MTFGRHCGRFRRLLSERADSELTAQDAAFFDLHRALCEECALEADADDVWRSDLRESAVEPRISDQYDTRLIRRWRLQSARGTAAYWMPAVVGGALTAAAFLLMLYFLTAPNVVPRMPFGEDETPLTRNDGSIRIPDLDFSERTLDR